MHFKDASFWCRFLVCVSPALTQLVKFYVEESQLHLAEYYDVHRGLWFQWFSCEWNHPL